MADMKKEISFLDNEKPVAIGREEAVEEIKRLANIADANDRNNAAYFLLYRVDQRDTGNILKAFVDFATMGVLVDKDEKTVRRWVEGKGRPKSPKAADECFRIGIRICANLYDPENPEAIADWLKNPNLQLKGKTPINLLRERDFFSRPKWGSVIIEAAKQSNNRILQPA